MKGTASGCIQMKNETAYRLHNSIQTFQTPDVCLLCLFRLRHPTIKCHPQTSSNIRQGGKQNNSISSSLFVKV